MAKDIAKKETTAVSAFTRKANTPSQIDRSDILIPKLLLMQGQSGYVAEEKAQMGQVVNSVTAQVVGGKGTAISFIPLMHFKDIARFEKGKTDTKPVFKEVLPWTPQNSELPWEVEINGISVRHMKRLNYYILLEKEMGLPTALPYLLSFTSSSYQNGRKLVTHFAQAEMANLEPCSFMFNLDSKKEMKDGNTYYIFDVLPNKQTPEEYAPKIDLWTEILAKGTHQVDNSDFEAAAPSEPSRNSSSSKGQDTAQF